MKYKHGPAQRSPRYPHLMDSPFHFFQLETKRVSKRKCSTMSNVKSPNEHLKVFLVKWWTLLNWENPSRCGFLLSRFFKGEALFSRAFILFPYHLFSLNFMFFLPSTLTYCSKLKLLFLHNSHRNCSITKSKGVTQRAKWTILAVTGTVFAFWLCFLTFFVNSLLLWWP